MKDLLEQIRENLPKMSKSHKQIADYILLNYDTVSYMTASKLGDAIDVSESTVVRFAYGLGFVGYPEFQKALKQFVQGKLTTVQRLNIAQTELSGNVYEAILKSDINNIKNTLDQIDHEEFNKIIDTLLNAKKIYVLGERSAATLAGFLTHYLSYLLPEQLVTKPSFTNTFEYLIQIKPEDCLVAISFPRYSKVTVDAMKYATKQGAKTIALTDNITSPLAKNADFGLYARSNSPAPADSLVAPLSLINAIVAAISLQRQDSVRVYFEKLEDLWGSRNIYAEKEK